MARIDEKGRWLTRQPQCSIQYGLRSGSQITAHAHVPNNLDFLKPRGAHNVSVNQEPEILPDVSPTDTEKDIRIKHRTRIICL